MYLFTLSEDKTVHAGEKVLPADVLSSVIEAKEMLEMARQEAEAIIARAKEEAVNIHKKAEEEGKREGLEIYNEHILYFDDRIKTLRMELQNTLLPIVGKTTRQIVGEGLKKYPELVVDVVTKVIKSVTSNHEIKLFVHKDDLKILEDNKEEFKRLFEKLDVFTIEERNDVERGSCIIQTEKGILNANLSNQYAALDKALQKTSPN